MTDQIKVQARSTSSQDAHSVIRVLRWYEKSGDRLVGETVLNSLDLPELQRLFQEATDNLIVDSYPVSIAQVDRLQHEIAERIDLSAYDYYVECDAV
ncbi:hypothetical protein [Leptolyngbya sp. FACHB-17]|uniref:DUF7683 domain-containing protein n=1 Tax=unclassified Leptolyngbya TaxID=2650499 RepID=UPI0016814916|nr:hypothetical protein [Leptolyngbya sp. FACHB-17]MBD2081174.1 hypothetical protein [Leptolyngbya sp. FACHB-17]